MSSLMSIIKLFLMVFPLWIKTLDRLEMSVSKVMLRVLFSYDLTTFRIIIAASHVYTKQKVSVPSNDLTTLNDFMLAQ